ncbi:Zinc finger protein 169 [Araneus ventricosus]|uniref:Zinc finger protein 169 n=1 Tax=Araneus ventricosus TaxID=182803 RepID=A0A4Y2P1V2_ARAVE|nr:Zinc finger protein 169 [Araneus ventricosus]
MESEENLQFSEYSPDEGSESSDHVKEDIFLNVANVCRYRKENESFMTEKRDLYEDNSQVEPYQNLEDTTHFPDNQSSDANASPYLGFLDMIPGFGNLFEDFSNENPQVHEIGNIISTPSTDVPGTLEYPPSVVICADSNASTGTSANTGDQNIFLDPSSNHVCDSDHSYAQVKSYASPICGKKFRMENAFLAHLQTLSINKLHQCKHCKTQFRDLSSLASHLNTHTEKMPYVCLQCNRRFEDENSFKDHGSAHSGEKPHVCEICETAFDKKATLKRHLRTHAGVKPYVCSLCPKVYGRKYLRDRHQNSHRELK